MKLRNKKTGEIGNLVPTKDMKPFRVVDDEWNLIAEYTSLAKLIAEWEDYEEPHTWYINDRGYVVFNEGHFTSEGEKDVKSIGNYFETKEEADKAVEKLKAWKKLRDKGFRFEGWGMFRYSCDDYEYSPHIYFTIPELDEDEPYHYPEDVQKDLDLLFGCEE